MTTRVDAEDIETTKSEKLLAVVLAVFILIGGLWAYFEIDEIGEPTPTRVPYPPPAVPGAPAPSQPQQAATELPAADQEAIAAYSEAQTALARAQRRRQAALQDLELRREAYRTALDAAEPTRLLESEYRQAQERFESSEADLERAQRAVMDAAPAAQAAQQRLAQEQRESREGHDRQTLVLRLALVLGMLGGGYLSLGRLRARRSRYLPASLAWVGASAALALVLAGDYISDYIDVTETGPLVLSLSGIALTLVALWSLQRYLATRIPRRRVRRGECPFCGFPVRDAVHCEGCGRRVLADCATCQGPRRVGTEHCARCGAG